MPELGFDVERAEPVLHAASPELSLTLGVQSRVTGLQGVLLGCQVRIETARRRYDDREASRTFELFGERSRWDRTQQSLLWTRVTLLVPPFAERTSVAVPLPCSWDFELSTTKYLEGLSDGVVPLLLLFSGTVFAERSDGSLQALPLARTAECRFLLPLEVYRTTLDHYYPNRSPLALERGVFERLHRYKLASGASSWEAAISSLLDRGETAS
ncbi:MAG TPA: DUF6084 family protein [Polyangiaceae bacterium]